MDLGDFSGDEEEVGFADVERVGDVRGGRDAVVLVAFDCIMLGLDISGDDEVTYKLRAS